MVVESIMMKAHLLKNIMRKNIMMKDHLLKNIMRKNIMRKNIMRKNIMMKGHLLKNIMRKNIMRLLLKNIIRKNIMHLLQKNIMRLLLKNITKNTMRKNIMRLLQKNIMRQKGSMVMTMVVMTSKWLHPIPLAHLPGRNMWLRKVAHHLRVITMYLLPAAQNGKAGLLQMLLLSNKRSGMLNPQPL
jgi:hypothetical protein